MTMLSSLSPQRKQFVLRLQEEQYAIIKGLRIVDHEPVFATDTEVECRVSIGSKNRQAKSYPADFKIKQGLLDFFAILDKREDCVIPKITAIKGLPRHVVFQSKLELA
jgi:hypothetical protein